METVAVSNGQAQKHNVRAPKSLATELKEAAVKSKVFNDACKMFAERQRTRQQITMQALNAMMRKKGYTYTREEQEEILKIMANLSLGTLQYNKRGRLIALKGISTTLQSIGATVTNGAKKVQSFTPRPQLAKLPDVPQTMVSSSSTPKPSAESMCKVEFTVTVDDKVVNFTLPQDIPKEDLGQFIASLYPRKKRAI